MELCVAAVQSPRVARQGWTTVFQCLGPPGGRDDWIVSNEDVWKAWQAAASESSILSLNSCLLSMGVVDWSGSLVPVTVHLFAIRVSVGVCILVWQWGIGWENLREAPSGRKSELEILGAAHVWLRLGLSRVREGFFSVSFSFTNHCLHCCFF